MRVALVLVAAVGGGCSYKAGSFSHYATTFPGERVTVGCLDLSMQRRADLAEGGAVIAYSFGNRCDRATTVDLRALRVEGRTFDGRSVVLIPFDPGGELDAFMIDGRMAGSEALAYHAEAPLAEVCIDAASLVRGGGGGGGGGEPTWRCFASRPEPPPTLAEVTP